MCSTGLTINFRESDYSISEGQIDSTIALQLRSIQNSFTVEIFPISFDSALEHFNFSALQFLSIEDTNSLVKATEGKS